MKHSQKTKQCQEKLKKVIQKRKKPQGQQKTQKAVNQGNEKKKIKTKANRVRKA
jgi:hypothetical protein